jgi:hypothetical protein
MYDLGPEYWEFYGEEGRKFSAEHKGTFCNKKRENYLSYWTVCRRWQRITRSREAIL